MAVCGGRCDPPQKKVGDGPAPVDTTEYPALYLAAAEASRRGRRNLALLSAGDILFSLLAALVASAVDSVDDARLLQQRAACAEAFGRSQV